jgi:hypothetical protein
MNRKALYYPYIHIHDVNWLKGTLLLFSEVRRMLPDRFTPHDDEEVRAFAASSSDRPALLSPANLWTRRARAAQEALARRLLADARDPDFISRYGRAVTRQARAPDDKGFQIHQEKLAEPLKDALRFTEMAWDPDLPESYDRDAAYVELHPRVGEAVMSTLAIAAAMGEGLDIVGDHRSGHLHECLLEKRADEIYDAWLHPSDLQAAPGRPDAEDLFEFLIGLTCDVTALTPDALCALQADRDPLRRLIEQLRVLASEMPATDPGRDRETYFRDAISMVLHSWRSDRSNMPAYWRKFFGEGLADTSQRFVEKVADNLMSGGEKAVMGGVSGATAVGIGGGGIAAMATAAIAGAGVGLAIGIVFHGVRSYFRTRRAEKDSPYRYLTLMEREGVVFRSDLGMAPRPATHGPTSA